MRAKQGKYVCVVEGAIPTKENGIDCMIGGRTLLTRHRTRVRNRRARNVRPLNAVVSKCRSELLKKAEWQIVRPALGDSNSRSRRRAGSANCEFHSRRLCATSSRGSFPLPQIRRQFEDDVISIQFRDALTGTSLAVDR